MLSIVSLKGLGTELLILLVYIFVSYYSAAILYHYVLRRYRNNKTLKE